MSRRPQISQLSANTIVVRELMKELPAGVEGQWRAPPTSTATVTARFRNVTTYI